MKAIEISAFGGPEVLRPVVRPDPELGPNDVLIQVKAAGVNRPDVFQRLGNYSPPPGVTDIPGLEVAGIVVGVALGHTDLKIGDEVCALVPGGGYAEFVTADARLCLPIPAGWSFIEAAGLPETFFTVWMSVFDLGQLHGDQVLLVHGGASGIGTAAVQIANALGHRVLATVGSDERARKIEALGASLGVNYRTTDFVTAVKEATNGRGANVILDMVGGGYVRRNMECVADEGRIVSIARLGGNIGEVNIGDLIRKRAIITGSTLRPRSVEFKALISEALRVVVWPLLESGKIRSVVHATFPFEMAEAAHRMMEEGSHVGKLILTMDH